MRIATVLLVDDHPPLRAGVAVIIERSGRYRVIAEAGSVDEATTAFEQHAPDIVIADVTLPDGTGIDVIRAIRGRTPSTRILVLSMHARRSLAETVLDEGAGGYLLKESTSDHLVAALDAIQAGRTYVDAGLGLGCRSASSGNGRKTDDRGPFAALSRREFEVFQLLAAGLTSKQIGLRLGISPKTVDNHRGSIMEKLEIESVADLVRLAIRTGVVDP